MVLSPVDVWGELCYIEMITDHSYRYTRLCVIKMCKLRYTVFFCLKFVLSLKVNSNDILYIRINTCLFFVDISQFCH